MSEVDTPKIRLLPKKEEAELRGAIARLVSGGDAELEQPEIELAREQLAAQSQADLRLVEEHPGARIVEVPLKQIGIGAYQLRESIAEQELEGLAQSISSKGIIQPVLVREKPQNGADGHQYEIVAGERRIRAAALAGLTSVPAIIQELDDRETLELAIIENAQREDLNPVEEAVAYQRLAKEFKLNQTSIAEVVGKNRATISNALRLLQLEPEVLEMLRGGEISAGHGRALLAIEEAESQLKLARRVVRSGMSVRALENYIASLDEVIEEETEEDEALRLSIERQQKRVSKYLGLDVNLALDNQGRRRLAVTFPSEASWKRFVAKIRE